VCKKEEAVAAASVAIDDETLRAVFGEVTGAMSGLFAQARTAQCAADYVRALVCAPQAGSTWGLAAAAGHASPGRFQALVREAVWDHARLIEQVGRRVVQDLAVGDEGVFIVDETAILKHGSASVGVSTQHAGVTGRLENCQTIVNAVFDNGCVEAWIDFRLYVPECWTGDGARREAAGVPEAVVFQTKPELAAQMLAAALEQGLPVRWLAGDEVYGAASELRGVAETAGLGFVMAVRANHWIDLGSGEHLRAEDALASVAPSLTWETRSCGTGSKGMRLYQWAHLGLADGTTLLMRRRTAERDCEKIDFYLCRAPAGTVCPPQVFLRIVGRRWPIEEIHRDAKQLACMDAYQVRTWTALHRHLALAMIAMLIYTLAEAAELDRAAWSPEHHLPKHPDQAIPTDLPPVPPSRYEIRSRLAALIAYLPPDPKAHQAHWSIWRRRYLARARWHHHQTRLRVVLAA
jgi:SRSO17 transposase